MKVHSMHFFLGLSGLDRSVIGQDESERATYTYLYDTQDQIEESIAEVVLVD